MFRMAYSITIDVPTMFYVVFFITIIVRLSSKTALCCKTRQGRRGVAGDYGLDTWQHSKGQNWDVESGSRGLGYGAWHDSVLNRSCWLYRRETTYPLLLLRSSHKNLFCRMVLIWYSLQGYRKWQGFPWGTNFVKSPISALCTQIVLFWWDFSLQGRFWDYGLALSLGISQKALTV